MKQTNVDPHENYLPNYSSLHDFNFSTSTYQMRGKLSDYFTFTDFNLGTAYNIIIY